MLNSIPEPDSPNGDYWARVVRPKVQASEAAKRARDLKYAAKCPKLEIKLVSCALKPFFAVVSVKTAKKYLADGTVKEVREYISQHQTITRPQAEEFLREAQNLHFSTKKRIG